IVRIALLTAQRRDKITGMKWDDIDDGVWTVPTDAREKGNIGSVALPRMALDVIEEMPRLDGNEFVFAGKRAGAYQSLSRPKRRLDKLSGVTGWTIHDLRRTARSLLSRAGVEHNLAERILGHTVGSTVSQTYDRHRYDKEKADALARLANQLDGIIHGREN